MINHTSLLPSGPGEEHYTLPARDGQTITIDVTSNGTLSLTITSPSGTQIFPEESQAGDEYRIHHTFVTSEEGEYRLTLTKADHTPSMHYTITVTYQ